MNTYRLSTPNGFGVVPNGPYPNQFGDGPVLARILLPDPPTTVEMTAQVIEWFNIMCFLGMQVPGFTVTDHRYAWRVKITEVELMKAVLSSPGAQVAVRDSDWVVESQDADFAVTLVQPMC